MSLSTGDLYTPRREYDGPNSALSGFAESFDSFAENIVNFAKKSGMLTGTSDLWAILFALLFLAAPANLFFCFPWTVCSLGFYTLGDLSIVMPALLNALRIQPISAFISNTVCMSFEISELD